MCWEFDYNVLFIVQQGGGVLREKNIHHQPSHSQACPITGPSESKESDCCCVVHFSTGASFCFCWHDLQPKRIPHDPRQISRVPYAFEGWVRVRGIFDVGF